MSVETRGLTSATATSNSSPPRLGCFVTLHQSYDCLLTDPSPRQAVDDEGNEILEDEEDDGGKKRGRRGGSSRSTGGRRGRDDDDPKRKRGSPGVVSTRLKQGMKNIVQMIIDYVDA